MRKMTYPLALLLLVLAFAGCRNETQNRIRRDIQDFTGQRMYITVYSWNGEVIHTSIVDGKVTRAEAALSGENTQASGSYVYWFDETGEYFQTDLPYLVSSEPQAASQTTNPRGTQTTR